MKKNIADILKNEGFVRDVEYIEDDKQGIIRVFLKYGKNNERVISGIRRISQVLSCNLLLHQRPCYGS